MVLAIGGHPVFAADPGTKPRMMHPLGHSVFAHLAASVSKLPTNLGAAIASLATVIDFANLSIKSLIIKLPLARLTFQPSLISATRHLKDSAHLQNTENSAVLGYEPEYRCRSV